MTRCDAAVLLFVAGGIYCLVGSLGFLSGLIDLFAPPVRFPLGFNPAFIFLSYLVPFGLLLAGGPLLIQGRHALAKQLFDEDEALPTPSDQPARVQALGSIALAALGVLCFFDAVNALTAVIQLGQPYSWHSGSPARMIMLSVLQPALLVAYLWLGWWLLSRCESLAARWLIPDGAPSQQPDSQPRTTEVVAFRVVGLYFVMLALSPLSHALIRLVAGGVDVLTANAWDFWPDAARGALQLMFGLSVFAGKKGIAAAWRKVVSLREV